MKRIKNGFFPKIRGIGPFTSLISNLFPIGQYPSACKLANVLPFFKKKKDDRQLKTNYRPVLLLPCLSKICEKVAFLPFSFSKLAYEQALAVGRGKEGELATMSQVSEI